MKNGLLILLFVYSFSSAMEKKRSHEHERESSTKVRPFDFHTQFKFTKIKKTIMQPEDFVNSIKLSNGNAISSLLKNNKVLLEQRLDFFARAALVIFCKNPQLEAKHKTELLARIKAKTSDLKHKLMRKHIETVPTNAVTLPPASSSEELRKQIHQHMLQNLRAAYEQINEDDKNKLRITQALITHLHNLAGCQRTNSILRLEAPLVVPHEFYLGYARVQAEKDSDSMPEVINYLKEQDTESNKFAYEAWINSLFLPQKN